MDLGAFIGLSVLSTLVFGAIYFISKEIIRVTPAHRKTILWLNSILVGATLMLVQSYVYFDTQDFVRMSIGLIGFAFITSLLDQRIMIGSVPFMMGSLFITYKGNEFAFIELMTILSIVIMVLVYNNSDVIKSNGIKMLIITIVMVASSVLTAIVTNILILDSLNITMLVMEPILFTISASLFVGGLIFSIEKIFKKYYSLEDSSIKDEYGFIKLAKVNETFKYIIDKERISKGLFYIFELKDWKRFEEVYYLFTFIDNKILLNVSTNQAAMFIPLSSFDDLENEIEKYNAKIKGILQRISDFNISLVVMGKDENEYSKIVTNGISSLPIEFRNEIIRQDFESIRQDTLQKSESAQLFEYIDDVKITHLASTKAEGNVLYSEYKIKNKNIKHLMVELRMYERNIVWRNISLKSIKQLAKDDFARYDALAFNYNATSFEADDFNAQKFIERIKKYIDGDIIISFLPDDFATEKIHLDKIQELRNLGVKFSADFIEDWDVSELRILGPEYIQSKHSRTFKNPSIDTSKIKKKISSLSSEIQELW